MRFKLILVVLGIFFVLTNLQAEWTVQHFGAATLYDMVFPPADIDTGFACGANSTVLKTMDGGQTWEALPVAQPSGNCNAIVFPTNAIFGLIACDSGNVQRTTDGRTWRRGSTGVTNNLNAIHFPKNVSDTGFVAGNGGKVFRTVDAGRSWFDVSINDPIDLYGAFFINTQRGRVIGANGSVFRTLNSGITWEEETTEVSQALYGIYSRDTVFTWIVGANKTFLKTTDRGWHWTQVDLPIPSNTSLYSVFFSSDMNTGWVCGSGGYIVRTTNGGTSWDAKTTTPTNDLWRLIFPQDLLKGWMCGSGEAIFHTTDGGAWIEETGPAKNFGQSILTVSPNPFRSGTVIRLTNSLNGNSTIKVYDCSGTLVRTLIVANDKTNWDGRNDLNQRVKSGVYLAELKLNGTTQRQKLVLTE